MRRGFASGSFESVTVRTPCSSFALVFSLSIFAGSVKLRVHSNAARYERCVALPSGAVGVRVALTVIVASCTSMVRSSAFTPGTSTAKT